MELLLIALPIWALIIWNRGRAEGRSFGNAMKIGWFKNKPEKLRELGATEDEISAAIERREKKEAKKETNKYNYAANTQNHLTGQKLYVNGKRYSVTGAKAVVESGATGNRMTATRVVAGALLAGPVGAIIGGMAKKDKSKCYLIVTFPDGTGASSEFPLKDEGKARQLADSINNAGLGLTV